VGGGSHVTELPPPRPRGGQGGTVGGRSHVTELPPQRPRGGQGGKVGGGSHVTGLPPLRPRGGRVCVYCNIIRSRSRKTNELHK